MSRAPAPSGNPISVDELRANFTLGTGKKGYSKLYIFIYTCEAMYPIYGCCTNFRTGSSCIVIQTAVEAREGPRLDHERFSNRTSATFSSITHAHGRFYVQALSHIANADRIDPRLIANKLSTKLGLYSHGSLLGFKNGSRLNSMAEHGYGISKLTRTLGWRIPRTPSSKSPVALRVAVEWRDRYIIFAARPGKNVAS